MNIQLPLDFSSVVHTRENNPHSEAILADNYDRLNKQCQTVLNLLLSGARLTVRNAMIYYSVGDLRRRCADLREKGIDVRGDIQPGGFKEFYLPESEIKRLKAV